MPPRIVGREAMVPGGRSACALLLLLILTTGCATFPSGRAVSLREEIDGILSTPPIDQVNWGIRVVDPERGLILYSRHANLKFIPASNMKILTTASALAILGTDYRYETTLLGVGSLQDQGRELNGDLLLRATGDPTLSERFYPSAMAPLDSLARGVWDSGIRSVTGQLVVDASAWDSTTLVGTWEVDDLPASYAATGGAFAIAEGVLHVEVTAGARVGEPARVRWWPFLAEEGVSADFVTVHPDTTSRRRRIDYLPESRRLTLAGQIPQGQVDTIRISQRDPVRLASAALLRALEEEGISVGGGVRISWAAGDPVGSGACATGFLPADTSGTGPTSATFPECQGAIPLAGLMSPPLAEIARAVLEPSQNWIAEQVIHTLGSQKGSKGSWEEGLRVERDFLLQEVGLDSLDIDLRDGSGLSAKSLITPRAMVRVLDYMRGSSQAGVFRNALASPGEEDSTLENRLPSLQSRVFAKTGSITHVNSLSGYVFTESGRELIFSILSNGSGIPANLVRNAIDRIVETLAGR